MFKKSTKRFSAFLYRFVYGLFLLPLAIFVVGCGIGCGGGGSKSDPQPETVYALSSQTRALQPGDTWTYDNHEKVTIASSTLNGQPSLVRITGGDGGEEGGYSVKYFYQNTAGDLIYTGQKGENATGYLPDSPERAEQKLLSPQMVLFGNWAAPSMLSFKLLYENNPAVYPREGEAATSTVVGTEKIKTPLGTFETWKVEVTPNGPTQSFQITGTYWYAPQLGTYVRAHEIISSLDPEVGGETDITLKATNVPLGLVKTQ